MQSNDGTSMDHLKVELPERRNGPLLSRSRPHSPLIEKKELGDKEDQQCSPGLNDDSLAFDD